MAATWRFRRDESRRRRGCDVDIPSRRVAAAPRLRSPPARASGRPRTIRVHGRDGAATLARPRRRRDPRNRGRNVLTSREHDSHVARAPPGGDGGRADVGRSRRDPRLRDAGPARSRTRRRRAPAPRRAPALLWSNAPAPATGFRSISRPITRRNRPRALRRRPGRCARPLDDRWRSARARAGWDAWFAITSSRRPLTPKRTKSRTMRDVDSACSTLKSAGGGNGASTGLERDRRSRGARGRVARRREARAPPH